MIRYRNRRKRVTNQGSKQTSNAEASKNIREYYSGGDFQPTNAFTDTEG